MNKVEYCKSIYCGVIKSVLFAYKTDNLLFTGRQAREKGNGNLSAKIGLKRINDQVLIGFPAEIPLVFNHGRNRFSQSGQPPPFGELSEVGIKTIR